MGCGCQNSVIVLANDSRIESEFNGDPAGYWDTSGNWTRPCAATSLLLYLKLLELSGPSGATVRVSVLVQGSIDGVSWADLDTTVVRSFTAVGNYEQRLVFPTRGRFMPLVRFGLQIGNDAVSGQVAARLSATVTPVAGDNELVSVQSEVNAADSPGVIPGTSIEVFGVSTLFGRVSSTGIVSTKTWNAIVEGSFDGVDWYDTGTAVALIGGSAPAATLALVATSLPAMVRLNKTGGDAVVGEVIIDLLGRAF